jgi:hypothetical protein
MQQLLTLVDFDVVGVAASVNDALAWRRILSRTSRSSMFV